MINLESSDSGSEVIIRSELGDWDNRPIDIEPYVGFVYEILELDTGMRYIGIKKFWMTVKLPALKGRTKKEKNRRAMLKGNRRHVKKETDWKTYNTSSPIMQEKLETNPDNYSKRIVKCCKSVTEMKCLETYMQLDFYFSGRWDKIYNECVNLRLRIPKNKGDTYEQKGSYIR